jgi:hypothetical protein
VLMSLLLCNILAIKSCSTTESEVSGTVRWRHSSCWLMRLNVSYITQKGEWRSRECDINK